MLGLVLLLGCWNGIGTGQLFSLNLWWSYNHFPDLLACIQHGGGTWRHTALDRNDRHFGARLSPRLCRSWRIGAWCTVLRIGCAKWRTNTWLGSEKWGSGWNSFSRLRRDVDRFLLFQLIPGLTATPSYTPLSL